MQRKQDKDTLIRQQASSSAIEGKARYNHQAASILKYHRKKSKMQLPGCKHPQVPWKEKQDAIIRQQASSSAIERKTRCNHRSASIFKCHRKKKQDAITRQQASSSAPKRKTRYNCLLGIIFKIWKIQVEDAFVHS